MNIQEKFREIYEAEKTGQMDLGDKLRKDLKEFLMGQMKVTETKPNAEGGVTIAEVVVQTDDVNLLANAMNTLHKPEEWSQETNKCNNPDNGCGELKTPSTVGVDLSNVIETEKPISFDVSIPTELSNELPTAPIALSNSDAPSGLGESVIEISKPLVDGQTPRIITFAELKKVLGKELESNQKKSIHEFLNRKDLSGKKYTRLLTDIIERIKDIDKIDLTGVTDIELKEFNLSIQKAVSSYITHALIEQEKSLKESVGHNIYLSENLFAEVLNKSLQIELLESVKLFISFFKELA